MGDIVTTSTPALVFLIGLALLVLRCIGGRAGMTMRDGWAMSFGRRRR